MVKKTSLDKVVPTTKSERAKNAKDALNNFILKINPELERYFENELTNVFGVSENEKKLSENIWLHIEEHCLRPAKRLRGSFVYYSYILLGGKEIDEALKAAMSIELVHTALLMHDDFMDQDDTRRGKPTTHEFYKDFHKKNKWRFDGLHYGESMAVTAGDIALLAGYQILGESSFPIAQKLDAQNRMLRGVINTGLGQAFDITLESVGEAKEQDIIDLHLSKTAIYTYENPLHIGAILAGATNEDLELLSEYAIPGGIAFQLQDDILGLFGDPEKTGKPAHSDLRQGKMTLLIIKALEKANPKQKKLLLQIWGNKNLNETDADKVRNIIKNTGSLAYSKKISVAWAKKAQMAIPKMHKNGWNEQAISYLDGIAQYMVEREI